MSSFFSIVFVLICHFFDRFLKNLLKCEPKITKVGILWFRSLFQVTSKNALKVCVDGRNHFPTTG